MRLQHPAHSRIPLQAVKLLLLPFALAPPPLRIVDVFCDDRTVYPENECNRKKMRNLFYFITPPPPKKKKNRQP